MKSITIHNRYALLILISIWASLPFFWSCEDSDCTSSATNNMIVKFFDEDSLYEKEVRFDIVTAEGTDSIFYDINDFQSVFTLPVHPAADSTIFYFRNVDETIDTLIVNYSRRVKLLSEWCGFEQVFSNLQVSTSFPEAEVITDQLSELNKEDVRIYH